VDAINVKPGAEITPCSSSRMNRRHLLIVEQVGEVVHAARRASEGLISPLRGPYMQDLGYELPRILILGTWVNKGTR
jgi:hypothetical protein